MPVPPALPLEEPPSKLVPPVTPVPVIVTPFPPFPPFPLFPSGGVLAWCDRCSYQKKEKRRILLLKHLLTTLVSRASGDKVVSELLLKTLASGTICTFCIGGSCRSAVSAVSARQRIRHTTYRTMEVLASCCRPAVSAVSTRSVITAGSSISAVGIMVTYNNIRVTR
jgi:hypothetical protein